MPKTVDQVIANEQAILGQSVTVIGFLRFGDDSRNLWANRKAYQAVALHDLPDGDSAWNRCITLYDIDGWRNALLSKNNQEVKLLGVLERHPTTPDEITMSECNDLGLSIRSVSDAR